MFAALAHPYAQKRTEWAREAGFEAQGAVAAPQAPVANKLKSDTGAAPRICRRFAIACASPEAAPAATPAVLACPAMALPRAGLGGAPAPAARLRLRLPAAARGSRPSEGPHAPAPPEGGSGGGSVVVIPRRAGGSSARATPTARAQWRPDAKPSSDITRKSFPFEARASTF